MKRAALALAVLGGAVALLTLGLARGGSNATPSTCFGTTAHGSLESGWRLPRNGTNFRTYSSLGWLLGRTFVHSSVHEVMLDAYRELEASHSNLYFVYGETGWATGGRLRPHRTHRNGLSVDFMVPVRNASGDVAALPTGLLDKLGYGLEFDDAGKLGELQIDFEAIAEHLAALKRAARGRGVGIAKVIFEPPLRARLEQTRAWPQIRALPFTNKAVWIRHDEHYHVDFVVPCD
jgi:penicillin-insensitive murein endopeptidase